MRLDDTAKNKTEKCVLIIGAYYLSMVFNFMLIFFFLKKSVQINFIRCLAFFIYHNSKKIYIFSIIFFHFGSDATTSDKDGVLVPSK